MKTTTKIVILIIVLTTGIVLGLIFRAYSPTSSSRQATTNNTPSALTPYETKDNAGGNVTVSVTPLSLKPGLPASFDVSFETHSVDLAFDVAQIASLTDNMGTTYTPLWEGSPPGGHHRSGTLRFAPDLSKATSLSLSFRDVAGIPTRVFNWEVQP